MQDFGVDTSKLVHESTNTFKPLPTVLGRVLQVDADFLAYQVSYDKELSLSDMYDKCDINIERLRLLSGAEKVKLHLTPSGSTKGNRSNIALIKEYQANRENKVRPEELNTVRQWMHEQRGAVMHMDCEADDGMAIEQYKAIKEGNPDLSIIASRDKDLRMVPGLQVDWMTGEITDTGSDPFGWVKLIEQDNKSRTKKIIGRGWRFFWCQLLMGDTADNIAGLPKVVSKPYAPGKPKPCGPVLAYDIIGSLKSNKEIFNVVSRLFKDYGTMLGFTDYRDGSSVPAGKILASEAKLLWLRRTNNENDVLYWMQETCL
jgi:DNA polymerase-1